MKKRVATQNEVKKHPKTILKKLIKLLVKKGLITTEDLEELK